MTNPHRLYAKLDKLKPEIERAVRAALASEANRIVALMRETVPKDTHALKESIGWTFGRAPRGKLALGSINVRNSTTRVVIYAGSQEAFYHRFQEFGTSRNAAQPYFWTSWRAMRGGAKSSIEAAAKRGISRIK